MRIRISRGTIAFAGFIFIGGYFLINEHSAHLAPALPYLPYLLLLACPVLHVFMHGGHGHGHDHGGHGTDEETHDPPLGQQDAPGSTRIPKTGERHE